METLCYGLIPRGRKAGDEKVTDSLHEIRFIHLTHASTKTRSANLEPICQNLHNKKVGVYSVIESLGVLSISFCSGRLFIADNSFTSWGFLIELTLVSISNIR